MSASVSRGSAGSWPAPYVPHSEADVAHMLQAAGAKDLDALFDSIPEPLRLGGPLDLEPGLTEPETVAALTELVSRHRAVPASRIFAGGGAYAHVVPAVERYIASRGEFLTAYTPYQPELSQGTLQVVFEFQTMVASLLGCDLANASIYDGASATAEAVLMALRVHRGKARAVVVSEGVLPAVRAVLDTYAAALDVPITAVPCLTSGRTDLSGLATSVESAEGPVVALLASPNATGCIEDLREAARIAHDSGGLLVATFAEPIAFGLVEPPGAAGADIVAGEGQALGVPLSFGGPYLGLLAARKELMRQLPGRLVGRTVDRRGRPCFTLTLATREQHIRRERATSNICTNQGLCALLASVYMSLLGPEGLAAVAERSHRHAVWLADALARIPGVRPRVEAPFFNEILVELDKVRATEVVAAGASRNLLAGVPLARIGLPDSEGRSLLVAVTDAQTERDLDDLVTLFAECTGDSP